MNKATELRLFALNEQFYQTFGYEFSATRQRLQPGVRQTLDALRGDEQILDLGCGNGEMARELLRRGHRGSYLGMDFSQPLLDVASTGNASTNFTFLRAHLTEDGWEDKVSGIRSTPFDLVTSFATLHHIPGFKTRLNILQKIFRLLKQGGQFIHSEWQFLKSKSLQDRIQAWETVGLTAKDVDPGDYLLDWRRGGRGLRYVHHFDETELDSLALASGFHVHKTFHSDGQNGLLGLYQVWEKI